MTNQEVIKAFLNRQEAKTPKRLIQYGYFMQEGRTLYTNTYIDKNHNTVIELVNYATPIARIENNMIYLNLNKYSTTTSKIQSQLKSALEGTSYIITIM